jgi:hypothetical protein
MDYETLNFAYFETYSFQRKGDFEMYEHLFSKYAQDETSLTEDEKTVFYKLRKSNLYNQENNSIFTNHGELNQSAELVYKSDKLSNLNDTLIEILKIPFVGCDASMCAPIYRDAILFYDTNDHLIDGINICFECSNVVNLKGKEILTDQIVYQKLKELLISIGHKIN